MEQAKVAGAFFPTSSVLLRPSIPDEVRQAVLAEIPADVLPREGDTAMTLAHRLAESFWLEDIHVLKDGCGPGRVRLNVTCYSQPRRKSWSVVVEGLHYDGDGELVVSMMNYTAYGRKPSDWEAAPIPPPVFDLGVFLWCVAFDFLTEVSKKHPPTGCQLLLYYALFGSNIGRHRDNYTSEQMVEVATGKRKLEELVEGSHHGGDANSQLIGSNVLVYTEGDADMDFKLSFPSAGNIRQPRGEYTVHPIFTTRLGAGTLLIFSPVDDVFFCHEASLSDGAGGARIAFVFRWLTQVRDFHAHTNKPFKMKLTPDLVEREKGIKERREKKRAADRRNSLRS